MWTLHSPVMCTWKAATYRRNVLLANVDMRYSKALEGGVRYHLSIFQISDHHPSDFQKKMHPSIFGPHIFLHRPSNFDDLDKEKHRNFGVKIAHRFFKKDPIAPSLFTPSRAILSAIGFSINVPSKF